MLTSMLTFGLPMLTFLINFIAALQYLYLLRYVFTPQLTTLSHISNVANSPILAIDEGFSCLDEKHIGDLEPILDHLKKYYHYIINISHIPKVHEHSDIIKRCVDGTIL